MEIKQPQTIEQLKEIRGTILELIANRHLDYTAKLNLLEKLNKIDSKIVELNAVSK